MIDGENMKDAQTKINKLKDEINKFDYAYYVKSESLISDFEYDKLFSELANLENRYPDLITLDSPTQRVSGIPVTDFVTVSHSVPMLSLANTYNSNDVIEFDKKIVSGIEGEEYEYYSEMKFDGVSISIKYVDGVFHQAVTRGDGTNGDDVTSNIKTIRNLPLKVNTVSIDGIELTDFEVRGELYIRDDDFLAINEKRIEKNEKLYANSRNLTAGSIKLLDSREVSKRPIQIVCYYLFSNQVRLKSQSENIEILSKLGFPTSNISAVCKNIDAVLAFIEKWRLSRFNLGFQTDGVVVKLNSLRQQDYLGTVGRYPRWAIAYKYEPEIAETKLNDITLQVGRTGAVTPVAELEPVFLAGSTIKRATLHNADYIEQLDLHIGDTVFIEKGGDIIPKVTRVALDKRSPDTTKYVFPTHCACELNSPFLRIEGEANHYCEHPDCPWQVRRRIEHFASRNAMNIDGLGEKVIDKLVTLNYIKNIADIYELHKHANELKQIEGWGEKSIDKLLDAIENSKKQPMNKILFAVGIRFVGEKTAKILTKHFHNIETLKNATVEDLTAIFEIGEVIAKSVYQFFNDEREMIIIDKLIGNGLNFYSQEDLNSNKSFNNLTFVFTGELKAMTRTEAAQKVEMFGGKETKSVSKKTSFVVVGESPGSKYDKAVSLGVSIISEEEFLNMLKEANYSFM